MALVTLVPTSVERSGASAPRALPRWPPSPRARPTRSAASPASWSPTTRGRPRRLGRRLAGGHGGDHAGLGFLSQVTALQRRSATQVAGDLRDPGARAGPARALHHRRKLGRHAARRARACRLAGRGECGGGTSAAQATSAGWEGGPPGSQSGRSGIRDSPVARCVRRAPGAAGSCCARSRAASRPGRAARPGPGARPTSATASSQCASRLPHQAASVSA